MAKKTVFQDIDPGTVSYFNIEDSRSFGIWMNSMCKEIGTVLGTESELKYDKIKSLLTTNTTNDLTQVKRAFVLPLCDVSAERIKAALKEHKIVVTNDYETADFIVSHDNFYDNYSHGDSLKTTQMMYKLYNYYFCNTINNYSETIKYPIVYDDRIKSIYPSWNLDTESLPHELYCITGLALELAHKIDQGNMHVIDVETILLASANKQTLTPQLVEDIINMMKNSDDRTVAGAMLPTIDFNKQHELLWELAQGIESYMHNFRRNKDVYWWYEQANIHDLNYMNAEDAILYFERKGVLNNRIFKYFEPICRKEISISNRELYTFTVQVKPEYRKLLTTKDNNYIKLPDECKETD
jgi:hypothetical protein